MRKVTVYTDGACSKNPGPGGWAGILIYNDHIKDISGYKEETTNNIMELTAVIETLNLLKEKCEVELYTDSKYIVDSITKWVHNWKLNGWKNAKKEPVKNKELWDKILELTEKHLIRWNWVKAHAGDKYNEMCDTLAKKQIETNRI